MTKQAAGRPVFSTQQTVMCGLLVAFHVVLCYVSINLGNMVITLSGVTEMMAGYMFGPLAGMTVGLMGSFLNQLLTYGLTVTTILWILPAGLAGLIAGLYGKRCGHRCEAGKGLFFNLLLAMLSVTAVNTGVMWADSVIYHYYSAAYVFGALGWRILSALVRTPVYMILIPALTEAMRPVIRGR